MVLPRSPHRGAKEGWECKFELQGQHFSLDRYTGRRFNFVNSLPQMKTVKSRCEVIQMMAYKLRKVTMWVSVALTFITLVCSYGEVISLCQWGCIDVNSCGCIIVGQYCGDDNCYLPAPPYKTRRDVTYDLDCCGFMSEQHVRRRFYDCTDPFPPYDCECRCYYTSPSWCP